MKYAVVVCAVLLVACQALALDVEHKILDNGLEVYVAENHNAPVFTMRVYVHAGSIHEDEFLGCGISHYCEHLVSGGTTHKRSEAEAQRIMRSIGGAGNAYTTSDHTCYYISTSATYMDSVIELLPDWVLNCAMDEQEVERENEQEMVQELLTNAAKGHYAVVGLDSTLEAINQGQVRKLIYTGGLSLASNECFE